MCIRGCGLVLPGFCFTQQEDFALQIAQLPGLLLSSNELWLVFTSILGGIGYCSTVSCNLLDKVLQCLTLVRDALEPSLRALSECFYIQGKSWWIELTLFTLLAFCEASATAAQSTFLIINDNSVRWCWLHCTKEHKSQDLGQICFRLPATAPLNNLKRDEAMS